MIPASPASNLDRLVDSDGGADTVLSGRRAVNGVALGLTEAQWIGVAITAIGAASWLYFRSNFSALPGSERTV